MTRTTSWLSLLLVLFATSWRFAASDDVAWFRSPKLTVGQQGVFLLRRGETAGTYVLIQPGSLLGIEEASRVKRLVEGAR